MRKICVVVASRANYARIRSAMSAIRDHPELELQVVATASALLYRFGEVIRVMERDGFAPVASPHILLEGDNPTAMAKSTGLGIIELASVFENLRPDVVLTIADRYETLATAVAASYMNIPLAHSQGGETSGSIDESVRHAISKLAHIHFPATKKAADLLVQMGEPAEKVFLTGCPALDFLDTLPNGLPTAILQNEAGVGSEFFGDEPYLVVMQHPVTTEFGKAKFQIQETLSAVEQTEMQAIWLWPNVDAGSDDISRVLRSHRDRTPGSKIRFIKNLPPEEYAQLIRGSACLVGNSSSGLREGAFLGVPVVNVGTRQQTRERAANVADVEYDRHEIFEAIGAQLKHGPYPRSELFGSGSAGSRIAEVLATVSLDVQKTLVQDPTHN